MRRKKKATGFRKGKRKTFKKRGRKTARRGKKPRIPRAIKEILDVTTPINLPYEYAFRQNGTIFGTSIYFPIAQYNDAYDLSVVHNKLQTFLGSGPFEPFNKFITSFTGKYTLTNYTNLNMEMDIYKIVARNDMDNTIAPQIAWTPSGTNLFSDPFTAIQNGYQEGTRAAVGSGTGVIINKYSLPNTIKIYGLPVFSTYYKIVKCKMNVKLIGGGQMTFKISSKRWKMWNGDKIAGAAGPLLAYDTAFRRRTVTVFAICRGAEVADTTNHFNISTGLVNVGVHGIENYLGSAVKNSSKAIFAPVVDMGAVTTAATILEKTEIITTQAAV